MENLHIVPVRDMPRDSTSIGTTRLHCRRSMSRSALKKYGCVSISDIFNNFQSAILFWKLERKDEFTQSGSLDIMISPTPAQAQQWLISPKTARILGVSTCAPSPRASSFPRSNHTLLLPYSKIKFWEYRSLMKTAIHSKAPQYLFLRQQRNRKFQAVNISPPVFFDCRMSSAQDILSSVLF